LWAFVENFRLFGFLCLLCLPLVLLFKRMRPGAGGGEALRKATVSWPAGQE